MMLGHLRSQGVELLVLSGIHVELKSTICHVTFR